MKTSRANRAEGNYRMSGAGFLMVILSLMIMGGCTTTETSLIDTESDGTYKNAKIVKIVLKNGNTIDCMNKIVVFNQGYTDSSSAFLISEKNLSVAGAQGFAGKTEYVPISDVLLVYQGHEKVDGMKTTFAVLGTIAGTVAGVLVIAFTLGVGSISKP
jgi:hypothetical protein